MHNFQGINNTCYFKNGSVILKMVVCYLVHFPFPYHYSEWFSIDSTCNILAVLLVTLQARALYSVVSECIPPQKIASHYVCSINWGKSYLASLEGRDEYVTVRWEGKQAAGFNTCWAMSLLQHKMQIFSKMLLGK